MGVLMSIPPLGKKISISATSLVHLQAFKMEMFNFSELWRWDEASSSSFTSSVLPGSTMGAFCPVHRLWAGTS